MRVVFFLTLFLLIPLTSEATASLLKIHFIDVGQGDSILIETPSEKKILIDGGPPEAGKIVTTYLKENDVTKLDLLISTHPHIDHIGGLQEVIQTVPIKRVLDSGQTYSTKTYRNYMRLIKTNNLPRSIVKQGEHITIDPLLRVNVLNSYEKGKTYNESAIVLQINFNDQHFLLMSDVEKKQEHEIMKRYPLKADVIKIGHHGSKTSSSFDFLRTIEPKIALLTYDVTNDYGHPAQKVINKLHDLNVDIYSTAVFGHMTIVSDGDSYLLTHEKNPLENLQR